ncbi:hypothetical protein VPH35_083736 [Triticum aestivum]
MLWVALYDRAIVLLARRLTGHHRRFTQLARMGIGFVILMVAMLAAGMLGAASSRAMAYTSSAPTGRSTCRCRSSGRCHSTWCWGRRRCSRSSGRWSSSMTRRQTPCAASAQGSAPRSRWATTRARRSSAWWCVPP